MPPYLLDNTLVACRRIVQKQTRLSGFTCDIDGDTKSILFRCAAFFSYGTKLDFACAPLPPPSLPHERKLFRLCSRKKSRHTPNSENAHTGRLENATSECVRPLRESPKHRSNACRKKMFDSLRYIIVCGGGCRGWVDEWVVWSGRGV